MNIRDIIESLKKAEKPDSVLYVFVPERGDYITIASVCIDLSNGTVHLTVEG